MIPAATVAQVKRTCRQVKVRTGSCSFTPACSRMITTTIAPPRMAGMLASGKVPLPHADTLNPPEPQKLKNAKRNVTAPPMTMTRLATEMCCFIDGQRTAATSRDRGTGWRRESPVPSAR